MLDILTLTALSVTLNTYIIMYICNIPTSNNYIICLYVQDIQQNRLKQTDIRRYDVPMSQPKFWTLETFSLSTFFRYLLQKVLVYESLLRSRNNDITTEIQKHLV